MIKAVSLLIFVCLQQWSFFFGNNIPQNFKRNLLNNIPTYTHTQLDKKIANDTLQLIINDDFIRYPFGAFEDIKTLKNSQPKTFISSKKLFSPYHDKSSKKEKVYYLVASNSYLSAYLDKNTKKYELVSSIILNNQIKLKNGISIGITKEEFIKAITNNSRLDISTSDVVKVESGNKKIIHYYKFADNKLTEIKIISEHSYKVER